MPAVSLAADDFVAQLEQNESRTINSTEGPGVALYVTSDGRVRVDIYVGLKLDGFKLYQNLSSVNSSIKMQFAVPPVILCQSDVLTFDPNYDSVINIQVVDVLSDVGKADLGRNMLKYRDQTGLEAKILTLTSAS